jgi:hypothetical protein
MFRDIVSFSCFQAFSSPPYCLPPFLKERLEYGRHPDLKGFEYMVLQSICQGRFYLIFSKKLFYFNKLSFDIPKKAAGAS